MQFGGLAHSRPFTDVDSLEWGGECPQHQQTRPLEEDEKNPLPPASRVVCVVYGLMTQQTVLNTYYGPPTPLSQQRTLLPPHQGDK